MSFPEPKVECSRCGRKVGSYVPSRGDGSGRWPRRHKDEKGEWCEGALEEGIWP